MASAPDVPRSKPPHPVVLREMKLDDLPAVYALGERLFRADDFPTSYRTWDEYELVDHFSSDGQFCLVGEQQDRIVGFVIGTVIKKRHSAWSYGYLIWIGVDPGCARQGIATRLAARLTELFIRAGARIMLVDTEAGNEPALKFFKDLGFGHPEEHVYLTRNLTQIRGYQQYRSSRRPRGDDKPPEAPRDDEHG